jgi:hypothetical protein
MMEAASTSETSVSIYETTLLNVPKDNHLHTHHWKNLKSHLVLSYYMSRILPHSVEPVMNVTVGIVLVIYVPKGVLDVTQNVQSFNIMQL